MKNKGFTLVELLVVVSVILISVGIAGDLIISIIRSYNRTRLLNEIEQNGNYVVSKMTYDLKNARSVTVDVNNKGFVLTAPDGIAVHYYLTRLNASGSGICDANGIGCNYAVMRDPAYPGTGYPITNYDPIDGVSADFNNTSFGLVSGSTTAFRIQLMLTQGAATSNASNKSTVATQTFDTTVLLLGLSQ